MEKTIAATVLLLFFIAQADAARIGVVVQFQDGSVTENAVTITDNASGYDVMNAAGLGTQWGGPHPLFGHSLCRINGIGTDPNPTGCEWTGESWAYWVIKSGGSSWASMPVGHDGGDVCWNRNLGSWDGHYCAVDGDIVGYVYGSYDPVTWQPPRLNITPKFSDIFAGNGKGKAHDYFIEYAILPAGEGNTTTLRIFDNSNNNSIKDAKIEVYAGTAGVTEKIGEAMSDREGIAEMTLAPDQYGLRISAYRFHQFYGTLDITTTTTTSTTTTTTTSTTSTTETTTTLRHFLLESMTTSTTETTMTTETTTTTESTTTTLNQLAIIGNAIQTGSAGKLPYVLVAIIIALPALAWLRR